MSKCYVRFWTCFHSQYILVSPSVIMFSTNNYEELPVIDWNAKKNMLLIYKESNICNHNYVEVPIHPVSGLSCVFLRNESSSDIFYVFSFSVHAVILDYDTFCIYIFACLLTNQESGY